MANDRAAERVRDALALHHAERVESLEIPVEFTDIASTLRRSRGSSQSFDNVGNPTYPDLSELGERAKVVFTLATEGDENTLTHPKTFKAVQLMIPSKIGHQPHVGAMARRTMESDAWSGPDIGAAQFSALTGRRPESWLFGPRDRMIADRFDLFA